MKKVNCEFAGCTSATPSSERRFRVPEEKRTDVNIAIQMVSDAYRDECDRFILVSGDSDLVPPIRLISEKFSGKRVIVYVPTRADSRGAAVELRTAAHSNRNFPLNMMRKMQFPAKVPDGSGGYIIKPPTW